MKMSKFGIERFIKALVDANEYKQHKLEMGDLIRYVFDSYEFQQMDFLDGVVLPLNVADELTDVVGSYEAECGSETSDELKYADERIFIAKAMSEIEKQYINIENSWRYKYYTERELRIRFEEQLKSMTPPSKQKSIASTVASFFK